MRQAGIVSSKELGFLAISAEIQSSQLFHKILELQRIRIVTYKIILRYLEAISVCLPSKTATINPEAQVIICFYIGLFLFDFV